MTHDNAAETKRRLPQRKWRFVRPERSRAMLLCEAVAVALVAHALLLLIDYREPQPARVATTDPGVTILSEFTLDEQIDEFNLWMTVNDPARFASVSSPGGYLAQLPASKRPLPQRNFDLLAPLFPLPAITSFIPVEVKSAVFSSPPLPASPLPSPRQRVINSAGEPVELPGLESATASGAEAPTHIDFRRNGKFCRVRLISSCGNPELDLLAEKALYREGAKLPEQEEYLFFWPTEPPSAEATDSQETKP